MRGPIVIFTAALLASGAAGAAPGGKLSAARCGGPGRVQCLINVRLVDQLHTGRPEVRQRAAETLRERGSLARDALPALERALLGDKLPAVRLAAAEAIPAVGPDPRRTPAVLVKALKDRHAPVRLVVCKTLKTLGTAAPKGMGGRSADLARAQDALQRVLLGDSSEELRSCAAGALARVAARPGPALKALGKALLNDRSTAVKAAAITALGRLDRDARRTLPILEKALCRKDAELRRAAAGALAGLGEKALPVLHRAIKHHEPRCRRAAIAALGQMRPFPAAAAASLRRALADKVAPVRRDAAQVIAKVGLPMAVAIPNLAGLLTDKDPQVRAAAARALGAMGKRAGATWRALKKATIDEDPQVREAARAAVDRVR